MTAWHLLRHWGFDVDADAGRNLPSFRPDRINRTSSKGSKKGRDIRGETPASKTMNIYIAGPMRGIPYFNRQAFLDAEAMLREDWHEVFNPVSRDVALYGWDVTESSTGDLSDIEHLVPEFSLREALGADLAWIAEKADAIYMLVGWENSKGARAEHALALALGLDVIYQEPTLDQLMDSLGLNKTGEVRTTSASGGEKGVKPERFDLIPIRPMEEVARVYGFGANKYENHNWRRGYEWSKSQASLLRHANAHWRGETLDPESGLAHLAHVVFHCLAQIEWATTHPEYDDRFPEA